MKRPTLTKLRQEIRRMAHAQLDALLLGPTHMPDGSQGTVLEDIMARSLVGYGFQVGIEVRHPSEVGRAEEDPSVTAQAAEPKPLVEEAP